MLCCSPFLYYTHVDVAFAHRTLIYARSGQEVVVHERPNVDIGGKLWVKSVCIQFIATQHDKEWLYFAVLGNVWLLACYTATHWQNGGRVWSYLPQAYTLLRATDTRNRFAGLAVELACWASLQQQYLEGGSDTLLDVLSAFVQVHTRWLWQIWNQCSNSSRRILQEISQKFNWNPRIPKYWIGTCVWMFVTSKWSCRDTPETDEIAKRIDYILCSDCIYDSRVHSSLLACLTQLCGASTTILLSYEDRKLEEQNFMEMFQKQFRVSKVDRKHCWKTFHLFLSDTRTQ
jgi:hypothetical protein